MGKSKPSVTLTNALLVLNVKLTYQRTCQHPDILASLGPLIFLKHFISETNVQRVSQLLYQTGLQFYKLGEQSCPSYQGWIMTNSSKDYNSTQPDKRSKNQIQKQSENNSLFCTLK